MNKIIKNKLKTYYLNTPEYYLKLHSDIEQTFSRKIISLSSMIKKKENILDVGCGCGDLCIMISKLTKKKSYGVDISPHAVNLAKSIAKDQGVSCELFVKTYSFK